MSDRLLALVRDELRAMQAYKTPLDPLPIKLDANESPFAWPDEVMASLASRVSTLALHRYPDIEARAPKEAIARLLETSPSRLVLGAGSDESIAVLLTALARPRAPTAPRIVVPSPSFVMYAHTARVLGLEPVEVPLVGPDFSLDVAATTEVIRSSRAVAAFFASPNNPTGIAYASEDLLGIAAACPETMIVIDEAYGSFRAPAFPHRRALEGRAPNVVFLGTLSKVGLASLRVGWIEADEALVRELDKARLPYDLPGPTQLLASLVLTEHRATLDAQIAKIVEARAALWARWSSHEALSRRLRLVPSEANFFLVEAERAEVALALHASLAERGIQVRAYRAAPLDRHLRVTVGAPHENDALLAGAIAFVEGMG